jgi:hypothetical protein
MPRRLLAIFICALPGVLLTAEARADAANPGAFHSSSGVSIFSRQRWDHALADVTGDGIADLILGRTEELDYDATNYYVNVRPGDGQGGLGAEVSTELPTPQGIRQYTALLPAWLNGDAHMDLIVARDHNPPEDPSDTFVVALFGNGDGSFTVGPDYEIPGEFINGAMADWNGDGIDDLIVSGWGMLTVLPGTGGGAFGTAVGTPNIRNSNERGMVVADFDEDGNLDAAIGDSNWSMLTLFRGDGATGTLGQLDRGIPVGASSLQGADLNRDGHLDLVLGRDSYTNAPKVEVFLGDGNGIFHDAEGLRPDVLPEKGQIPHFELIDLGGDGITDIAFQLSRSATDEDAIWVARGNGAGGFGTPVKLYEPADFHPDANRLFWTEFFAGDLDADGDPDIAALGDPDYPQAWFMPVFNDVPTAAVNVLALTDTGGDGYTEVATRLGGSRTVMARRGSDGAGMNDAEFLDPAYTPIDITTASRGVQGEVVAMIAQRDDGLLRVQTRTSQNGWLTGNMGILNSLYDAVAITSIDDINGNGVEEIAVLTRRRLNSGIRVQVKDALDRVKVGRGDIAFLTPAFVPLDVVRLPDLDGNGFVEIGVLAVRRSDARFQVEMRNAGGVKGNRSVWFTAGFTPIRLRVIPDQDGNGIPELAVLMRRNSDGRFMVQRRNAFGPAQPVNQFFLSGDYDPIDMVVVQDQANAWHVVVLAQRTSDGAIVVERRNATGSASPSLRFYLGSGFQAHLLHDMGDTDANGQPNLGVVATRIGDGQPRMEIKNMSGTSNTRLIYFN